MSETNEWVWPLLTDAAGESEGEGVDMALSTLRGRVLGAAQTLRPPATAAPPYAQAYASRVSALDVLLGELFDDDWRQVVIFDWTVQDLLAHLTAKDGLVASAVGREVEGPEVTGDRAMGRTVEMIAYERVRLPLETRMTWRRQAQVLCSLADPDRVVTANDAPLAIRDQLLARAFETWVHSVDIASRVGVRLPSPVASHVNAMADLGARHLPLALLLGGLDRTGRAVSISLTGPGGGSWVVPLGFESDVPPPAAHITMDVLDFCYLLGGRRDPATVAAAVSGDADLARDVLVTAPNLSGP